MAIGGDLAAIDTEQGRAFIRCGTIAPIPPCRRFGTPRSADDQRADGGIDKACVKVVPQSRGLDLRQALYQRLAETIWNPDRLAQEATS